MLMEQEVPGLLRAGLLIVIVPVMILVANLMRKYKHRGYGWFLSHLLLFTGGALTWVRILETRAFASSAYNSLMIAAIGVVWTFSMVCFVQGLLKVSRSNGNSEQPES